MTDENGHEIDGQIAGQHIRVKGYRSIDVVLMVLVAGVFVSATYVYRDQQEQRRAELAEMKQEHAGIESALRALNDTTQEQTYVLTLKQDERERLNLSMPPSLRAKLYDRLYDDTRRAR